MAAEEVMTHVHDYMMTHPESELHRRGKMFGVLIVENTAPGANEHFAYVSAFSAMLDGTYRHEGFVPPIVDISLADGYFRQEEARISALPVGPERKQKSQALQRWLFAEYKLLNGVGETRNMLDVFAGEKPILTEEEFFGRRNVNLRASDAGTLLPPAGAGECCAPKLLQYAYANGLKPLAMAEFWIGAATTTEVREYGRFYPACSGKCKPILRHMLQGLELDADPMKQDEERLLGEVKTIYDDEWLRVVVKPAGLKSEAVAKEWMPAHRLDQDTSGLLVIAKTAEVYKALQKQFVRRDVEKRYEALVEGIVGESGVIELPLLPNPMDRPRQMVNMEHGKFARTRYILKVKRDNGTCLVDFFPETGRTHQLRVHAAHALGLGAPIVGDRLYGTAGERLMLHAAELTFEHPVTGKTMHFVEKNSFCLTCLK